MAARRPPPRRAAGRALAILALGVGAAACDDAAEVEQLVASLRSDDQTDPVFGEATPGEPEIGAGAGPNVLGPVSLLPGSTGRFTVSADDRIDAVLLGVAGQDGFFRLPTRGDADRITVRVSLAPGAAPGDTTLRFWTELRGGPPGQPTDVPLTVLAPTAAGELQVVLSWDGAADLDLHVLEPAGTLLGDDGQPAREEIWWGNPAALSGGQLAQDTGASCLPDDVTEERVTWLSPLEGAHAVLVDPWSTCGVTGAIPWRVTVRLRGEPVAEASGSFQPGDETMGSNCVGALGELTGGEPAPELGDGLASRCPTALTYTYTLPE